MEVCFQCGSSSYNHHQEHRNSPSHRLHRESSSDMDLDQYGSVSGEFTFGETVFGKTL